MMDVFLVYFQIGLHHVLDMNAYDHVLFLMALTAPYAIKDWKQLLILVSFFTLGHSLALCLSVFEIIVANVSIIEFLILATILITAVFGLFSAGKTIKNNSFNPIVIITTFFGIIHGFGFSNYFKTILSGTSMSKIVPLTSFALGIEVAQLIVVCCVLLFSFVMQSIFRFSKRDFVLIISGFIIGVVLPLLIEKI